MTQQEICTRFRERQAADNQLPHKAAMRAAAREAGEANFAIPRCGGGFTDHHISTETGRCVECRNTQVKGRKKRKAAAAAAEAAICPSVQEVTQAPLDSGGHRQTQ